MSKMSNPKFDQVVKGNVDIKQLSKKKYKITFSKIGKFLKYQVWSDSSTSLNKKRTVYYQKAKKWVQDFKKLNESLKASNKPLFTPTTVMEIGNKKYLFVIHEAKLNGKRHVVFKVSTEEIKLSEKKMLKLPCGHHDGVRFDIDDSGGVSPITRLEFNGNPLIFTKPGGLPPDISYPQDLTFDLIYPADDADNNPSSIIYIDTGSLNGVNPSFITSIKILDVYDGKVEYLGLRYEGFDNLYEAKYKLPDNITNSYFKSTLYPNSKFKIRIIPDPIVAFRYTIASDITFVPSKTITSTPLSFTSAPRFPYQAIVGGKLYVAVLTSPLTGYLSSTIGVSLTNINISTTNNTCGAVYYDDSENGNQNPYIVIQSGGQFTFNATQPEYLNLNENIYYTETQLSTVVTFTQ